MSESLLNQAHPPDEWEELRQFNFGKIFVGNRTFLTGKHKNNLIWETRRLLGRWKSKEKVTVLCVYVCIFAEETTVSVEVASKTDLR